MNDIDISVEGMSDPPWLEGARAFADAAIARLGGKAWDLSIVFCDDAFIRDLNRQYRDKDEATDVLSFEQGASYRAEDGSERLLAGDIVISLPALARNAADFAVTEDEELKRLILHGLLHLSGHDHATNEASEPMLVLQEKTLAAIVFERIV